MKTPIDLKNWNRREHFEFFSAFDEPFFGATIRIDCTESYSKAKSLGISFFVYYLYQTLKAVNEVEAFRLRIENNQVWLYDRIDASATIARADGTFGFSLIEYSEDLEEFNRIAKTEIKRIQECSGLLTREFNENNLIHFSAIPWLDFTSLSHARSFKFADSCPKISFGKIVTQNSKRSMPVSIHVHHGLMDGLQLGQFSDRLQSLLG